MVLTILFGVAYGLTAVFQCDPISGWWSLEKEGCIDAKVIADITYAASALNSIADWLFAILPIFMVWNLNQPKKTRVLIGGILSLAAMCVFPSSAPFHGVLSIYWPLF